MDSGQGKLFIGGISVETTEERLKDYFSMFGEVREAEIKKDRITGRGRGFGFLVFADPAVADRVLLKSMHTIDGQMVEVKKAISRDELRSISITSDTVGRSQNRTKKIFVGGLAPSVTENDLRNYFEQFGPITQLIVMYDPNNQRPRGFGFVEYESEDVVDKVVQSPFHQLNGKTVEVKRSNTKANNPAVRGQNFGSNHGQGFSSTPVPPMNPSGYGSNTFVNNASSYGTSSWNGYGGAPAPVTYGGPGAARAPAPVTYGGPGAAPAPAPVTYGGPGAARAPATGSYGGARAPVSYGGPVAYGAGNSGNGGHGNTNNATPAGSNMWGTPAMAYGNTGSSVEYGSGGINPPGQAHNGRSNRSSAGYTSGYGSSAIDNAYGMGVTTSGASYRDADRDMDGSSGNEQSHKFMR